MAVASMARGESTMDTPIDTTVHRWNIATQSLCIIMMTIFFWLRVYARSVVLNGFSMEDCELLVVWVMDADLGRDLSGSMGKRYAVVTSRWYSDHE